MIRTVVTVPGGITVTDATTTTGDGTPPVVVGSPPQWTDDSDATYAELDTFEHPDVSYADSARGTLERVATAATSLTSVYARVRYSSLAANMKPPRVLVTSDSGIELVKADGPGAGSADPTWVEFELTEASTGGKQVLLDIMNGVNPSNAHLTVIAPFLNTIAFRNVRTRVFEAHIVIGGPISEAPPCRLFPREDGLGVGSGRHFPPAKSRQRSSRRFGYY